MNTQGTKEVALAGSASSLCEANEGQITPQRSEMMLCRAIHYVYIPLGWRVAAGVAEAINDQDVPVVNLDLAS